MPNISCLQIHPLYLYFVSICICYYRAPEGRFQDTKMLCFSSSVLVLHVSVIPTLGILES